jgi:hypothetical protein
VNGDALNGTVPAYFGFYSVEAIPLWAPVKSLGLKHRDSSGIYPFVDIDPELPISLPERLYRFLLLFYPLEVLRHD